MLSPHRLPFGVPDVCSFSFTEPDRTAVLTIEGGVVGPLQPWSEAKLQDLATQ